MATTRPRVSIASRSVSTGRDGALALAVGRQAPAFHAESSFSGWRLRSAFEDLLPPRCDFGCRNDSSGPAAGAERALVSVVPSHPIACPVGGLDGLKDLALPSGLTHLLRHDHDSIVGLGCHANHLRALGRLRTRRGSSPAWCPGTRTVAPVSEPSQCHTARLALTGASRRLAPTDTVAADVPVHTP